MVPIITLLLLLLFQILIRINITTATTHCSDSGNFTSNGTYAKNLDLLLSSLPSDTAAANELFFNASIGQDPDRVHLISLCRADSSTKDCTTCVNSTIQEMREQCPGRKEAYSWQGAYPCIVRYSNRSLLGELELSPTDSGYNTADITTNITQFDQTWESLMKTVLSKASAGSDTLKFATGNVKLTSFQTIYTIMQCTPDLTQNDCEECLGEVVSSYQSCCHGKQGGYVHKPSCFFRWDLYPFYNSSLDASPPPAPSPLPSPPTVAHYPSAKGSGHRRNSSRTIIIVVITSILFLVLVAFSYFLFLKRKPKEVAEGEAVDGIVKVESLRVDFDTIRAATNDFSDDNKLGQGGFGIVYKGVHSNGQAIAVKRLSVGSGQGELEFKNEVMLVAKLEHRNLVRLLGFCYQGEERLLIYELVKNSSLDRYIFDPLKRRILNWEKRYRIITGIARGLLYLHEDSRLRVIHRDLKASNILLNEEMNPKIADFGMARLFAGDQTHQDTGRIVGTFGYMPPEYIVRGQFSIKSDVFSFGVLVLEIISGQKIGSFRDGEGDSLLAYAWKNWNEGRATNMICESLRDGSRAEMMRCIHIGLLCVQEDAVDRPNMGSVALMLGSHSMTLQVPSRPAFYMSTSQTQYSSSSSEFKSRSTHSDREPKNEPAPAFSVNDVSISELYPR